MLHARFQSNENIISLLIINKMNAQSYRMRRKFIAEQKSCEKLINRYPAYDVHFFQAGELLEA
jgi:hypothetical protein